MTRQCYVSFWFPRAERDRYYALLEQIGCLEGWYEASPSLPRANPHFHHVFDTGDPRLPVLLALLKSENLEWIERHEHLYDDAELKTFPLVWLWVKRASIDGGGRGFGTEYDLSAACGRCGSGAIQTSPLMMPLQGLPKTGSLCTTHHGHVLVSKEVATALRKERVSGLELRQVRFFRNNEALPWWQMISTFTMPRMSVLTKGVVHDEDPGWGCPVCGRDCFARTMKQPTQITYDCSKADPNALPDVVQTWELFGRSVLEVDPERDLIPNVAEPLILVTIRVFEVFRRLHVKEAAFDPVWFV